MTRERRGPRGRNNPSDWKCETQAPLLLSERRSAAVEAVNLVARFPTLRKWDADRPIRTSAT